MAKQIHIVLTHIEAAWVLAGLAEKYKEVAKESGGGSDIALNCMRDTISQILQELYDEGYKIMQNRNSMHRYVKLINFKPIQEL